MKVIERSIARHENGNLYLVVRRGGRRHVVSLRTSDLEAARLLVREKGIERLISTKAGETPAVNKPERAMVANPVAESLGANGNSRASSFDDDLARHFKSMILLSKGTREMAERGRRAVETYCVSWEMFLAPEIWNAYRQSGILRFGKELGSAANHLRWYLRKLVPWAIKQGLLDSSAESDLVTIPKVKVNPRTIRVPSPEQVDEFLKMVRSEDAEGEEFLRFLAATGLRKSGAIDLEWPRIDLANRTMVVRMKGGRMVHLPLSGEAASILARRMKKAPLKPWPLDSNALEKLERKMKRFAKGFDLDIQTFHSFRHYFASRALMSGLTVQEVASLLGHSDGGVLVLKTYGHICSERLTQAVKDLRLTS